MIKQSLALILVGGVAGCAGAGTEMLTSSRAPASMHRSHTMRVPSGSLGPVLTTSDGGEIFGFDIDQNGNDGLLSSSSGSDISVQTFDETTGKITKTFGTKTGRAVRKGDDYVTDGILYGDVGLIDFQRAGKPGKTPAHDLYHVINPVSGQKFTGGWNPSIDLFNVLQWAVNQSTPTSVFYGYQREGSDTPKLIVSNVAKNTVSKVIALDSQQFALGAEPQLAEDTIHDQAVMATSPSYGAAGGPPPVIATVNLKSGKVSEFNGLNCPGSVGCGYADGIAYDSATGVACTTTALDGGVEFYNVAQRTGVYEHMPDKDGEFYAGSYVVNDSVNHLFLIAQPFSSTSPSGSSVQVYDESGSFVESINGLNFTSAGFYVTPVRIAINPNNRIGWVNGPSADQLQEFSY
ncbi:MAG: hypothetical protein JOZ77_05250 [Candidatus Eremiobacteraeota bacterium]|nr:hypothetical protein [Candidatus Eremiobacteraeota bacterium]